MQHLEIAARDLSNVGQNLNQLVEKFHVEQSETVHR